MQALAWRNSEPATRGPCRWGTRALRDALQLCMHYYMRRCLIRPSDLARQRSTCAGLLTHAMPGLRQAIGILQLPEELLRKVIALSWAARPEWSAAEEVHHAVELHSVCRALRASLRAQRLPLVLDFGDAPLTPCQRAWLTRWVTVGVIVSLAFHHHDWRATINTVIKQHCRTLRQLVDVPLQCLAVLKKRHAPAVDLSSARALTHLQVWCSWGNPCSMTNPVRDARFYLFPRSLPPCVTQLELVAAKDDVLPAMEWVTPPAEPLPQLQRILVTGVEGGTWPRQVAVGRLPLVRGLAAPPALAVFDINHGVYIHADLFLHVSSLYVECRDIIMLHPAQEGGTGLFVPSMCSPALKSVVLDTYGRRPCVLLRPTPLGDDELMLGSPRAVLRAMLRQYSARFAFEVRGTWETAPSDDYEVVQHLAWRVWPPPGSPEWQAAAAAHAQAEACASSDIVAERREE